MNMNSHALIDRARTVRGRILATGGAGYIGSHVVVALMSAGYDVVILDNFENSERANVARLPKLACGEVTLVEGDVRDEPLVTRVLRRHAIDGVVHLAGKKAVGESVADPLLYHRDNIGGALSLLGAMREARVHRLVFSSSATVYGNPATLPIAETAPTCIGNPYGRTKLMIEEIIDDCAAAESRLRTISLRYFNPVGAHPSGLIGEDPRGVPNNLFPFVAQTAAGRREAVQVFGDDYPTPDGTGIRDYIHVMDLARGHVAALDHLLCRAPDEVPNRRINLGTGRGYSVLEVINAFSEACGSDVSFRIAPRRPGDAPASVADVSLARDLLKWEPRHDLADMCRDHWTFQQNAETAGTRVGLRMLESDARAAAVGFADLSPAGLWPEDHGVT